MAATSKAPSFLVILRVNKWVVTLLDENGCSLLWTSFLYSYKASISVYFLLAITVALAHFV